MFSQNVAPPPTVLLDLAKLKFLNCGVGQLCLHLAETLLAHDPHQVRCLLLLPESRQVLFAGRQRQCVPLRNWYRQKYCMWSRYLGYRPLRNLSCDIWHWTHQDSEYWPPRDDIPVVLNILDLNFLHEGKSPAKARQRLRRLQAKVDRAHAILAISQFTANEVRTHLDTGDKPVHVVHLGVESSAPRDSTRPSFLPPGAFLFTIGDISPKKNFGVLIDLAHQLPEYRLVVAGRKTSGYARAMQQEISRRGLQHQILMPGEVSDDQRQWLYEHCTAFLFPSLAEGFGLPVLEAMMRGRPVFMSDRTSLPEIGGPLGFYWRTFEPAAMADVCRKGLRFVQDRPEYSHQLRRHAEQFSWQRTAQQYLAIYQELSGGRAATPIQRPCTARRDCA